VNDRFGHHAGDTVLKGTASLLLRAVRHNDSVLRLGGEEFAVVLPNTSAAQAAEVAEAMRYRLDGHRHDVEAAAALQVTGSFGVAQLMPGESLREALRRADAALYLAKQAGRNRVCLATAETPLADEPHSPTTNTVLALFRTN
jgi:diguanylate cyclase (GGDEF)-like protein